MAEVIHIIADFSGCPRRSLVKAEDGLGLLRQAVDEAALQAVQYGSHQFEPEGYTAFALLAESHISIHTWPEKGTLLLDIFTCGPEEKAFIALEVLQRLYQPGNIRRQVLRRGQEEPGEAPFHPG